MSKQDDEIVESSKRAGIFLLILILIFMPFAISKIIISNSSKSALTPNKAYTKEEYLQIIREKNPTDPEYYACISSHYIDAHSVEAAIRIDTQYGKGEGDKIPQELLDEMRGYARSCDAEVGKL